MLRYEYLNFHCSSNHSNLEIEAECPTKNLSYLDLDISGSKNGRNNGGKRARIRKSYRTY